MGAFFDKNQVFELDYSLPSKQLLLKYDINTEKGFNRVLMISDIKNQNSILAGKITVSKETYKKVQELNKRFNDYLNSPENN